MKIMSFIQAEIVMQKPQPKLLHTKNQVQLFPELFLCHLNARISVKNPSELIFQLPAVVDPQKRRRNNTCSQNSAIKNSLPKGNGGEMPLIHIAHTPRWTLWFSLGN